MTSFICMFHVVYHSFCPATNAVICVFVALTALRALPPMSQSRSVTHHGARHWRACIDTCTLLYSPNRVLRHVHSALLQQRTDTLTHLGTAHSHQFREWVEGKQGIPILLRCTKARLLPRTCQACRANVQSRDPTR